MSDPDPLPLDSPNWIPTPEAHRLLAQSLGNPHLAAKDLTVPVAKGDVPCMCRDISNTVPSGQDRKLMPLTFFEKYEFQFAPVINSNPATRALQVVERGDYLPPPYWSGRYFFFLWKPALQRIWPDIFCPPPAPDQPPPPPTSRGAGAHACNA